MERFAFTYKVNATEPTGRDPDEILTYIPLFSLTTPA
jgi:hypothetical protein